MIKFILVLVLCSIQIGTSLPGEAWIPRAKLVDHVGYFTTVMQELIYELERRGWSSLTLSDIKQDVNTLIANWQVNGTVLYTNGFLKSIQKLDVSNVSWLVSRRSAENVTLIPRAAVTGRLHFHHIKLGFDVLSDIKGVGKQRYTGEIICTNVAFDFDIVKNLITEEFTVNTALATMQAQNQRMSFRPENHITQVLSRNITGTDSRNGVQLWAKKLNSMLEDIVKNKVPFPRICFNDCST